MSAKRNSPGLRAPIVRLGVVLATVVCTALGALSGAPVAAAPSAGPSGPTQVAIIMPMTVPDARNGLLSASTLAAYTAPNGLLTRELDAVVNTQAVLGIDPLIIASIRLLGTAAPASATEWLARLGAATNETFALTWADSDITAAVQAGSPTVLAPTSLEFVIDPALFGPAEPAATNAPGGDAPSTAPPLPDTESLLAWDYTLGDVAWPIAGTVVASDLPVITASGFTTTVLGSGNVQRDNAGFAAASVDDEAAIVTDDAASQLLATASAATTLTTWQDDLAALGATIDASGATSMVLAVDRGAIGGAARLRSTITALDVIDGITVSSLSDTLAAGSSTATLVETPHSPERIALTAAALAAEAADAAFAQIAVDPTPITAERRLSLLSSLAPTWDRYPTGADGALVAFTDDSLALRDSVQILSESDIIFPDRGFLPVTVSNTLDQPVTVYVVVTALSPLLDIENGWVETTIEPNSQRRALIPAVARSNGIVTLSVGLASAAGVPVGTPVTVTANVQAGWETPLTIGLGIIIFLVFAGGIYRTILRRRKARVADTDGATAERRGAEA